MNAIPEKERHLVPWPLRFILWVVVVLFCALIGSVGGYFLTPFWRDIAASASRVPIIADAMSIFQPGPAFFAAVVGIVVNSALSNAYRGIRGIGKK